MSKYSLWLCLSAFACTGSPADSEPGDTDAEQDSEDTVDTEDTSDTDVTQPLVEDCGDGVDNDEDKLTDCDDPDCELDCTPVDLVLLTVSDWHGQLDPMTVTTDANTVPPSTKAVAGAAVLSSYFAEERASAENVLTLTAGDAFGASPPLSAFFEESTAVLAMNAMGFDADTFGNHNFDRGTDHLQSMIDLAEYDFVSSNLDNLDDNLDGVASPYQIVEFGGARVALIGITNDDAPDLTFPGYMGTLDVLDSADAAMEAKAAAEADGANVFVALVHMGATGEDEGDPVGPLIDFAHNVSGFHVIVGDHTDFSVSETIGDQIVVENVSKGATYARIALTVMPATGEISASQVDFVEPIGATNGPDGVVVVMPDDSAIVDLLAPYREELTALYDTPVGTISTTLVRDGTQERLKEMPIGNLVADAFRDRYDVDIAFINGGSIRAPLPSSYTPANTDLRRPVEGFASGPPYDLVLGDVYTVQPFGNELVTLNITGAVLWEMLEWGLDTLPLKAGKFPQISGFNVVYDVDSPAGDRVVSVELEDGTPVLPDSDLYSVITTDFLALGGDGYSMLTSFEHVTRELDADVFRAYIEENTPVEAFVEGRMVEDDTLVEGAAVVAVETNGSSSLSVAVNGGTAVVSVEIDTPAPPGGTVVALTDTSSALTTPTQVTVPEGSISATFRIVATGSTPATGIALTASAEGGSDSATVALVSAGVAPSVDALVMVEVLADSPSDDGGTSTVIEGDQNCDGTSEEPGDEFVEFYNASSAPLALAGVSIWDVNAWDVSGVPRYTFGSVTLGAGEAVVVFGATPGTTDSGPWCSGSSSSNAGDAAAVAVGGAQGLGLNNSGDTVRVTTTTSLSSTLLDTMTFTSGLSEAWVREEISSSAWVQHSAFADAASDRSGSPGTWATGAGYADTE